MRQELQYLDICKEVELTCMDRVYASIMGAKAVELLLVGKSNRLVAYKTVIFIDFGIGKVA